MTINIGKEIGSKMSLFKIHDMEPTTICMIQKDGSYGEVANTERSFGDQEHNAQILVAQLNRRPIPTNPIAEVLFFQDGTGEKGGPMWCAVRDAFVNLAESDAGFGVSMDAAYADLIEREGHGPHPWETHDGYWTPISEFHAADLVQDVAGKSMSARVLFYVNPYGPTTGHYDYHEEKFVLHSVINREAVPSYFHRPQECPQAPIDPSYAGDI